MQITRFEDILSWQKGKELTLEIYRIFRNNKDYSFRDQIQRAAVSVGNNIAEGYERKSNKELKQFLFISKGSCGEVRSMLALAIELGYVTKDEYIVLNNLSIDISRLLSAFIKKL